MSSEELFDDAVPNPLSPDLSPASLGSTPIEFSGVVGGIGPSEAGGSSSKHCCLQCGHVLKTRSGLTKHLILHKISDYNLRKPHIDRVRGSLPEIFKNILTEMEKEPAIFEMGAEKKKLIKELAIEPDSHHSLLFLEAVSEPILDFGKVQKRIMPSVQFEETLKELNVLLCNSEFYLDVKSKLLNCISGKFSDVIINRFIWRIATKLMFKIQEQMFHDMKQRHLTANQNFVMNDKEQESFKRQIEKMIRAVYRLGLRSSSNVWKMRCKSLRERFVFSTGGVSDEQFTSPLFWKENSLALSEASFALFLGLEKIIQKLQSSGSPSSADIVFDSLASSENFILFDEMRHLSRGILSEDAAVEFLKDLVKSLTALSGKMDAERKLQHASKKQKTSQVSLRTNLKRDPKTSTGFLEGTDDHSSGVGTNKNNAGSQGQSVKRKGSGTTKEKATTEQQQEKKKKSKTSTKQLPSTEGSGKVTAKVTGGGKKSCTKELASTKLKNPNRRDNAPQKASSVSSGSKETSQTGTRSSSRIRSRSKK